MKGTAVGRLVPGHPWKRRPGRVDGTGRRVRAAEWILAQKRRARRHPTFVDAGIASLILLSDLYSLVVGIPSIVLGSEFLAPTWRAVDAVAVVVVLVQNKALVWRRRAPVAVFAVVAACFAVTDVLGYAPFGTTGLLVVCYGLGAHTARPGRTTIVAVAAAIAVDCVLAYRGHIDSGDYGMLVVAVLVGFFVRMSRNSFRAADAERLALAAERKRIAFEIHDIVSHNLGVVVVQAGVARKVVNAEPAAVADMLSSMERLGRQGMSEMRQLLHVLQDGGLEPHDIAPQPTRAELGRLVEQARAAGVDASLKVIGAPVSLPASLSVSVYRVVQESLTNIVKHAAGARAAVVITYRHDRVDIAVHNDAGGSRTTRPAEDLPAGFGLLGMRERVALLGGTLHAGPAPRGGFDVRAQIPLRPEPA